MRPAVEKFNIQIDWKAPISEATPCGPNTEFDTLFAEMEIAATPTEEQQYGSTVIARKEPDWQHVLEMTLGLLERTRDLRVLLLMTRSLTRLHGLSGLLYGLDSVRSVVEHFWDSVHPQITIDGETDPHVRFNALCNFADLRGLAADMRQCIVFKSPLGALTIRDLEKLQESGSVEVEGIPISLTQVSAMVLEEKKSEGTGVLNIPKEILDAACGIYAMAKEKLASEFHPDFSPLNKPLQKALSVLDVRSEQNTPPQMETEKPTNDAVLSLGTQRAFGGVTSRKDALAQLDAVCRYLEINEPTNPAQLMIRRSMKVMEMNFMDILKHLAPEGLTQASFVTGVESSQEPL